MNGYCFIVLIFNLGLYSSYVIKGTVVIPSDANSDWFVNTRINVDGDQFIGFVKPDGSFEISNVPSGSYMIEVINPNYYFHPSRVDISSKGRIRARRVNAPQPNAVKELPYPLRMTSSGKAMYFKQREQLRTIDLLFNPNVLYVLVPFLLVMLLTKLVNTNDPELQKEMQQMNLLNSQHQMPDMSELLSSMSLFGSNKKTSTSSKRKSVGTGIEKTRHAISSYETSQQQHYHNHGPSSSTSPSNPISSGTGAGVTTVHKRGSKMKKTD